MLRSKRLSSQSQFRNATSSAPLARNAKGEGVCVLQCVLIELGLHLPITTHIGHPDGVFGHETEAAVKQFQRNFGLKPDGFVGPLTLQKLDDLIMSNPNVLETLDLADVKGRMALDAFLPLGLRTAAYW